MNGLTCTAPIAATTLLQYWLRELSEPAEAQVEEHFLGCDQCSATLQNLVDVGDAIRACVRRGVVRAVVTNIFMWRLIGGALRIREYRVPHNGKVSCTVGPDDDVVVARMKAPLKGVDRLNVVLVDVERQGQDVLEDVPFDASTGEVLFIPDIERLRELPASTARIQLVAVEPDCTRVIGEYTFHHTPWTPN